MPRSTPSRATPWLTCRAQQRLLCTVQHGGKERDMALVSLLLHTGLRVGELCTLTWGDVQLTADAGSLKVLGSRTTRRGGRITLPREIPLNAVARMALHTLGYAQCGGSSARICMGQRGPLTARGAEILFAKYARQAGMPEITLGTLRHTFCRNLVEAGADVATIAALAGHPTLEGAWRYFTPQPQSLARLLDMLVDET